MARVSFLKSLILILFVTTVSLFYSEVVMAKESPITTETLLDEMVNLNRLGMISKHSYETVQFSSADRRSNLPGGKDWFANSDGFGWEPIPAVAKVISKEDSKSKIGTYLLVEINGPGALVRCWTASGNGRAPGMNGEIRMYLDGAKEPVFSGSAKDFLTNLFPAIAKTAKLSAEGLKEGFHQRDAGYYPVVFAKSCRIEWTGKIKDVHFYHIELRKYSAGVAIQTFKIEDLNTYREKIKAVGKVLANPSTCPAPKGKPIPLNAKLESKKPNDLLHLKQQSGQITQIKLKLKADDLVLALRQTKLLIYFDGNSRPQIETPLGDFFAAAPGINPYDTVPMKVASDGTMTCRFPMPFKSEVKIVVENRGSQLVELSGELFVDESYQWTDRSLHFYALWRVDHDLDAPSHAGFDVPFLFAKGEGRFVGCSIHLMCPSHHPMGNWWGEGDEKLFIDDNKLPVFFGTGSEDYFNYSWSSADLFQHAYFAQSRCDGPDTRGFVANNRWHILDDVPFKKHFSFSLEMLQNFTLDGITYARITYLYARPGLYTDQMPISDADLREPKALENWMPIASSWTKDAKFIQMESMEGAKGMLHEAPHLSLGKQILWQPKEKGDVIMLTFEIEKAGEYDIALAMSHTPNSGICEAEINGVKKWMSLYTPYHTMLRNHFFRAKLREGKNELKLSSLGKHEKSKGMVIGGDILMYTPVKP